MQHVAGRCRQDPSATFVSYLDYDIASLKGASASLAKAIQFKAPGMLPTLRGHDLCRIVQRLVTLRPLFKMELREEDAWYGRTMRGFHLLPFSPLAAWNARRAVDLGQLLQDVGCQFMKAVPLNELTGCLDCTGICGPNGSLHKMQLRAAGDIRRSDVRGLPKHENLGMQVRNTVDSNAAFQELT